jgi:hypothetical protein
MDPDWRPAERKPSPPTLPPDVAEMVRDMRRALEFYAGKAKDGWWEENRFMACDKFGGLDAEIAGPRVALDTLARWMPEGGKND